MFGNRRKKRRIEKETARLNALREKFAITERITDCKVASFTHIGTRKYQQDSAAVPSETLWNESERNICVLSDGMGGLDGGERASRICTETVMCDFYTGEIGSPAEFLHSEISKIDSMVAGLRDNSGNLIDSGATFIATVFEDEKLYWASVGDSRIYLIRGSQITAFNEDHNYYKTLKEKVKKGEITQAIADADTTKEALISYIGMDGVELVDGNDEPFILQDGDVILLCSDGLFKSLSEAAISGIVRTFSDNIPMAAKILTYAAVDNRPRGQDNTTVILVKYNNKK